MEKCPYNVEANKHFRSREYLKRYTDPMGDPMKVHSQFLSHWHSFYSTHGQEIDDTNASLLEFGGGPTIYSLISACHRVAQITFADYADTNREEVLLWRNNEPECHDWRPYIDHVVTTLEGNRAPSAGEEREIELRRKLKNIIPCDIMADQMLGQHAEKFDVIHTNLCIEIVCETLEDFTRTISKLRTHLKPNGFIVCLTAKGGSWYTCAGMGEKFHQLHMNELDIATAFENAGLTVRETSTISPQYNPVSATKAFQFTVAQNNSKDSDGDSSG